MLKTPEELKRALPLGADAQKFIAESREIAREIVRRENRRLAIVVGPCSIHESQAALEYADRLQELAKQAKDCFLVMRVFVEKPRSATGWKGLLYDPNLDESHALEMGLQKSRELFLELAHRKIPVATEFVDPLSALYFDDLITWGFIGARTSASQPHRQLASLLPFPVGFKNGLDGDIEQTVYSLLSAASKHAFLYADKCGRLAQVESSGNPDTHLVLRGSTSRPNYDAASIAQAAEKLSARGLRPKLMIDCAHGNCQKDYEKQKEVFCEVLGQTQENSAIMGLMLESHLHAGNQSLSDEPSLKYGVSITDPCLDWSSTEELILSVSSCAGMRA